MIVFYLNYTGLFKYNPQLPKPGKNSIIIEGKLGPKKHVPEDIIQ